MRRTQVAVFLGLPPLAILLARAAFGQPPSFTGGATVQITDDSTDSARRRHPSIVSE
jgi:hypothetical protein